METLIWMFFVAVLVVAGLWTAARTKSVLRGAVWFLVAAVVVVLVVLIGPSGITTEAVPG